jgi:hypothetical protein
MPFSRSCSLGLRVAARVGGALDGAAVCFTAPGAGFVLGVATFAGFSTAGEAHATHASTSSSANLRDGLRQDSKAAVIETCA